MKRLATPALCLMNGDCLEKLKTLTADSVDAIVTDPPYGISFMSRKWDYDVPSEAIWRECLRVLKPGGHLLAFAGTRTQHRMAVRIEDAGFEIRDMLSWVYGSGFPKSLNVSASIDKKRHEPGQACAVKKWEGWGTALKPAVEPITMARKPFRGTVAECVQEWGTGAINVDGCRVGDEVRVNNGSSDNRSGVTKGSTHGGTPGGYNFKGKPEKEVVGRFPSNFLHDGSDEVLENFPKTGNQSAARFFYCAKPSTAEREEEPRAWLGKKGSARMSIRPSNLST